MKEWENLLAIPWPKNACDRSGECCRGAAQVAPWRNLLQNAANGDVTARDFLNQFVPYPDLNSARTQAPDGVAASLEIARARGDCEEVVVFYRCRFLKGQSECQIYEDRPGLCRDFPESPFGAIPRCCGYYEATCRSREKLTALRQELSSLKELRSILEIEGSP